MLLGEKFPDSWGQMNASGIRLGARVSGEMGAGSSVSALSSHEVWHNSFSCLHLVGAC
jgi:hypothetical protein